MFYFFPFQNIFIVHFTLAGRIFLSFFFNFLYIFYHHDCFENWHDAGSSSRFSNLGPSICANLFVQEKSTELATCLLLKLIHVGQCVRTEIKKYIYTYNVHPSLFYTRKFLNKFIKSCLPIFQTLRPKPIHQT